MKQAKLVPWLKQEHMILRAFWQINANVVCVISLVLGIHCFKRNLCKYYEKKNSHLLNEKPFFSYRLKLQMFFVKVRNANENRRFYPINFIPRT